MTDAMAPTTNLEWALYYAQRGLKVFPCWPTGERKKKTPIHSQYSATDDPDKIRQWWTDHPDALIGHLLSDHHVILDIDPRHGGADTWAALKAELGFDANGTRRHVSGRGDGGGHAWFCRPADKLTETKLAAWAKARGFGHAVTKVDPDTGEIEILERWSSGIDVLHSKHRYTILPPSIHPDSGQPYQWLEGGLDDDVQPMCAALADLITRDMPPPAPPRPPRDPDGDSIAEWVTAGHLTDWRTLLARHGWTLVAGDGDSDGSRWRHPTATSAFSATIRYGCLFVYSPNTPFEPTSSSDPHGITLFRAYAVLEHGGRLDVAARAARHAKDGTTAPEPFSPWWDEPVDEQGAAEDEDEDEDGADPEPDPPPAGPQPIDWTAFWAGDGPAEDWLCEPFLPAGRQVALFATAKAGKSLLALEAVAAIAAGLPCLHKPSGPPRNVVYIDLEMTEDDLRERLESMGYGPDIDLSHLHYYLLPTLPAMDTVDGGKAVAALADRHQADLVVIDTVARAVEGEENSADTYHRFYRAVGLALKQRGVALLRLDHAGKDPTKGQRGSSAKDGDVDVVWQLEVIHGGVMLRRIRSRMAWVPETVTMTRDGDADTLTHRIVGGAAYGPGTGAMAALLDKLGVPLEASCNRAASMLRAAGEKGSNQVIRDAQKYRRNSLAGWGESA